MFSYILGNLLYFISSFFSRNEDIWIFGSWGGNLYADNPKYFYDYVKENHKNIRPIWLSRNRQLVARLKKKGVEVYHIYSLTGMWFSCRASIGVTSHGMIDLNRYACSGLNIVQTWHGIPMKPILRSDPKIEQRKKRNLLKKMAFLFPFLKKELNYEKNLIICSSSEYVTKEMLKKCFGNLSPIKEVGFPRIDGLFDIKKCSLTERIASLQNKNIKIGLFMPTYRRKGEYDIIGEFLNNRIYIEKQLIKENSILFLKIHPFDFYKIPKKINSQRILIVDSREIDDDIYSILRCFDYLITDFSSIIFDYLVLQRPIMLYVPDREDYINKNGAFLYDYLRLGLPVYAEIKDLFNDFNRFWKDDYLRMIQSITRRIHTSIKKDNCIRLYEEIQRLNHEGISNAP